MSYTPYAAQNRLIEAARERPEIWRLAVGLALAAVLVISLNTVLLGALVRIAPSVWGVGGTEALDKGLTPKSMLVTLFSFGFVILAVGAVLHVVHKRSLRSLIGPLPLAISQFVRVSVVLIGLGVLLLILPPYNMGMELVPNLSFRQWLPLFPLGLIGVLIQSGSEEVLFRGYIQQQLAARFRSPLIWMSVPSLLFAFGHYLPSQAGDNAILIALWSGLFGVLMADLTARAGTLGPAIAVHVANNISALLFVALPDSLSGLALFVTPMDMSDTGALRQWLPVDFATMVVFWLGARLAIRV